MAKNKKSEGFFYKLFPFTFKPLYNLSSEFRGVVWIHAVSLGELRASVNFIDIIQSNAHRKICLSVTTATGYGFAQSLYKNNENILIIYFPYDFYFSVASVLRMIKPVLFISVETEIWPNLINMLNKKKIPVAVINARMSEKSYRNYLRFNFFFRHVFKKINKVLCTSEIYSKRFSSLGISREKVRTTGNMKFDMDTALIAKGMKEKAGRLRKILNSVKIIAAGSTHAGEENIIIGAAEELSKNFQKDRIFLFIAPRHPERFNEVSKLLDDKNIEFYKLSLLYSSGFDINLVEAKEPGKLAAVLVDMIGELLTVYSISDVAFVGGSMVDAGGHNLLEPLFFGKPVIFGSYVYNFLEIAGEIENTGSGKSVGSPAELYDALAGYLFNQATAKTASESGMTLISRNRGSSMLNFNNLSEYLEI